MAGKKKEIKVAVFALVEPEQKRQLEELARANQRSIGFLVREAIDQYLASLASLKKK
jgi:predicted transcriptional regulator